MTPQLIIFKHLMAAISSLIISEIIPQVTIPSCKAHK